MVVKPKAEIHYHVLPYPVHEILVAVGSDTLPGEKSDQKKRQGVEHGKILCDQHIIHYVLQKPGRNNIARGGDEHAPHGKKKSFSVGAGGFEKPQENGPLLFFGALGRRWV